jgi:hypothetical protein
MAAVYGLAGMCDRGGQISFNPRPYLERLHFTLTIRGQQLEVATQNSSVTYLLRGAGLTIYHRQERVDLKDGEAVTRAISEEPPNGDVTRDRDPRAAIQDAQGPGAEILASPSAQHAAPENETR